MRIRPEMRPKEDSPADALSALLRSMINNMPETATGAERSGHLADGREHRRTANPS